LLAIDGIVFDVTAGRSFYGPSEWDCQWFTDLGSLFAERWDVWELRRKRCFTRNGEAVVWHRYMPTQRLWPSTNWWLGRECSYSQKC
jgi:hypothetical protein